MQLKQRTTMIFATALLATVLAALAQGAAEGAAVEASGQWNTLWDYWKVGGFAMYPIGLCSVGTVALTVYCWLQFRTVKMLQPLVVPQLKEALKQRDINQAKSICQSSPGMLTNILGAGLARSEEEGAINIDKMEKAMEESSVEEVNEGMKPLTYLSVISQVAPMFGLLGTVTGMIGAFNKIGLGSMGDPEKLASNIGEAMITTAAGLLVAIPTMFAYFGFKTQLTGNVSRASRILGDIIHQLSSGDSAGAEAEGVTVQLEGEML